MSNPQAVARDEFFESLLGDFFDESGQLLDRLNENLLQVDEWVRSLDEGEQGRCDDALINEMFRSAHSLKGLSAMLGLQDINNLTHKVENVFDAARKDQLAIDGDVVELMFQAVDRLVGLVDALKAPQAEPVECESVIEGIRRMLQAAGAERQQSSQADAERALAAAAESVAAHAPTPPGPQSAPPVASNPLPLEPADEPAGSGPTPGSDDQGKAEGIGNVPPSTPPERPPLKADAPAPFTPAAVIDLFQGLRDEAEISDKYLSIFIDETVLSLDELTETLLAWEGAGSREAVEKLLVTSHRIKGSAASVGLNRAAKLAHLMEDVFQNLVETGGTLSLPMTDAMLGCTDALREYVDDLRTGGGRSDHFSELARDLVAAGVAGHSPGACGHSPRSDAGAACELADSAAGPAAEAARAADGLRVSQTLRTAVTKLSPEGVTTLVGEVYFQPNLALVGLKARLVFEKLSNLGEVCYFHPPAEQLDELEGIDRVSFGIATEKLPAMVHRQLRVAGVRKVLVELLRAAEPDTAPAPRRTESLAAPVAQAASVQDRETAASPIAPSGLEPRRPVRAGAPRSNAASVPALAEAAEPRSAAAKGGECLAAPAQAKGKSADNGGKPSETLRVDIDRLDQLMNLAGQLVINKSRFAQIGDTLKLVAANRQSPQVLNNVFDLLDKMTADEVPADPRRLQQELAGLKTQARRIQHDLQTVRREVEALTTAHGAVNDLGEAIHQLDRVTDGIQRNVMDTRMVPIGPLFARFKRVVRDITRVNGKNIRLVVNGEKTELDKRMIDELGDPLIHMVRNSADHGVELPEVRAAAGKPPEGTITLDAFHRGNSIVIQVSDDGKGLDTQRILQKAIEKGLVVAADAERMTRQQIFQLIWEPGLSTAEKVTEVSGRGMGMDIVKSKIEALSGSVDLESTLGQGTTMTIKLPLTLAILPSLMVEIGSDVFAMPVESVAEIVSVGKRDLSTVHGLRTAVVRGRVISLVRLNEVFSWNHSCVSRAAQEATETTLVIVGDKGREIGMVVDRVLGEEDVVIKSMAENYRNVAGIAGASILGDGRVSLILDIVAVIDLASRKRAGAAVSPSLAGSAFA